MKVASEVEGQLADPSNQFSFSLSLASERENPSFTLWRWGGILPSLFLWNSFLFVIFFGEIFKRWNFQEQCIFTSSCLVPRIFASQLQKQICFPPNFNEGKGAQCAMCTQRERIFGDPCCKYIMSFKFALFRFLNSNAKTICDQNAKCKTTPTLTKYICSSLTD